MNTTISKQEKEGLNNPPNPVAQKTAEQANPGPWRGVFFDGPEPQQNAEGDEIPTWCLYVGDEEAEPTGTTYDLWRKRWVPLRCTHPTDFATFIYLCYLTMFCHEY